jgi:pimeloyl-ACP methyl ester carboxylesterase
MSLTPPSRPRPLVPAPQERIDGLAVYRRGPLAAAGAPRVVLVHGVMDRAGGFVKLLRRLGHLDVIRYDRRGYGASRPGRLNPTIAAHVDDLVPSVAAFESPLPWRETPSAASAQRLVALAEGGDEAAADAAEEFLRRMLGEPTWARLPGAMRRDRRDEGGALVADMLAARQAGEVVDLAALSVPVIAGYGDRSSLRHQDAARALGGEAPDARLWVIEGAAHPAHYTHPAEFARFVEAAVARRH